MTAEVVKDGRSKKRPGLEEHRRSILDAAVDLFSRQGSRAVSISQICSQAGISRPTFYRCFEDKEALIFALYQDSVNAPVQDFMLQGLIEGPVGKEALQQSLDQMFDAIFEHARFAELVFMESNDPGSPAYEIVNGAFDSVARAMQESISRSGRPAPSRVYLKSVMAACQWIVHDAIRKGLAEDVRTEAKAAAWELVQKVMVFQVR